MKRIQIHLDEAIWQSLKALAQAESTTISELIRKAVQTQYFNPATSRAEAMQALVGLRSIECVSEDSPAIIRRLRRGTRLSRLTN